MLQMGNMGTSLRGPTLSRQSSEKPALGKPSRQFATFIERNTGLSHLMLQNANGHGR